MSLGSRGKAPTPVQLSVFLAVRLVLLGFCRRYTIRRLSLLETKLALLLRLWLPGLRVDEVALVVTVGIVDRCSHGCLPSGGLFGRYPSAGLLNIEGDK